MSMKLIDALLGEPEEKEFQIGEHKIVLRTLRQNEINEIMNMLTRADLTMIELEKVPTLARSLVSIDGINPVGFEEIREKVEKDKSVNVTALIEEILGKMDSTVINVLFSCYSELREETQKKKTALKKNTRKK